jgi:hypothetical protein
MVGMCGLSALCRDAFAAIRPHLTVSITSLARSKAQRGETPKEVRELFAEVFADYGKENICIPWAILFGVRKNHVSET